jgi:hypothetical protein
MPTSLRDDNRSAPAASLAVCWQGCGGLGTAEPYGLSVDHMHTLPVVASDSPGCPEAVMPNPTSGTSPPSPVADAASTQETEMFVALEC